MSLPLLQTGGGSSAPGGSSGDIQFNNAGVLGGETLVPLAHGGTNADLSATGGATSFMAQAADHSIAPRIITQTDLPIHASMYSYLPNVKLVTSYTAFTTPANGSQNDIYTVPAGKRAILFSYGISNAAGGAASTFQPTVKISGTYYKLFQLTASLGTGAGIGTNPTMIYIAEAGEIFSLVQTTSTTFFVVATIIEFDNTAAIKTVKVTSPASGDNTLYTPSGSKTGMIVANGPIGFLISANIGPVMYNNTVGTLAIVLNYLRGAAAASTSNRITGSVNVGAGTLNVLLAGLITISNGDTLSINVGGANATGLAWVNVMEF